MVSGDEEVTVMLAPAATARAIAIVAIPPPAPTTSIDSPLFSRPRTNKARYVVKPTSGSAAASAQFRPRGLGATQSAGTLTNSA
jgi:hypothetical protein